MLRLAMISVVVSGALLLSGCGLFSKPPPTFSVQRADAFRSLTPAAQQDRVRLDITLSATNISDEALDRDAAEQLRFWSRRQTFAPVSVSRKDTPWQPNTTTTVTMTFEIPTEIIETEPVMRAWIIDDHGNYLRIVTSNF